jgi:hypothetical protein
MDVFVTLDEIKKFEKVGNFLKIKLKPKSIYNLNISDASGTTHYAETSILMPYEKEITIPLEDGTFLFGLVNSNLLDAKELTEKDKEKIKKDILKGHINIFAFNDYAQTFKKIFKPEDFKDIKFNDLVAKYNDNLSWEEDIDCMLDIANHLNKKEEFKEKARSYLIKELKWLFSEDNTQIDISLYVISNIFIYYPELKEEIVNNEKIMKKIRSLAKVLKKKNDKTLFKELVKNFRLKEYLVELI